ncbi:MAG: tetratricopeptide repeat protein [Syntrophobacteraceae bacterium]
MEESLKIWQTLGDKPNEAASWGQLAQIHLLLGDLLAAERHARKALKIHESLGLNEVWTAYQILSQVARACGDTAAAAEWARKRDELRAELKRRAGGGGSGGLPARMIQDLQRLTHACARAGFGDGAIGPAEEEAMAQLDQGPAPFPGFAACLRCLVAGELPAVPTGLPIELREMLESLVQDIRKGQGG